MLCLPAPAGASTGAWERRAIGSGWVCSRLFSDGVVGLEKLGAGQCCAARVVGWSLSPFHLPSSLRALRPARRGLVPVLSQWPRKGHMGPLPEGLFLFT